ncbi:MAG: hypothetical protein O2809_04650 [Proteobacteria bacterium]|nr:hypothetical protein [Pseudomonadota bacterium]
MTGLYKAAAISCFLIGAVNGDVKFTIDHVKPISTISNNGFLYMTFRDGFSILKREKPIDHHEWIAYLINSKNECQQFQYDYDGIRNIDFNFRVNKKTNYYLSKASHAKNTFTLEMNSNIYCYNFIKKNLPQ